MDLEVFRRSIRHAIDESGVDERKIILFKEDILEVVSDDLPFSHRRHVDKLASSPEVVQRKVSSHHIDVSPQVTKRRDSLVGRDLFHIVCIHPYREVQPHDILLLVSRVGMDVTPTRIVGVNSARPSASVGRSPSSLGKSHAEDGLLLEHGRLVRLYVRECQLKLSVTLSTRPFFGR